MKRFAFCLAILSLAPFIRAAEPAVEITPEVIYGRKDGLAMTLDVYRPRENANGAGVLFMVSGGWVSPWAPPDARNPVFASLTSRGFTVFAVRHGSSPRYGIPDAVSDVRRSVRFIRSNAAGFQVDPARLGVFGMSAGGHLSLMLGMTGDEGKPGEPDPVMRASSRVQAVVAYVAPADLTIMARGAPDRLPAYDRFPALDLDLEAAAAHSPLALARAGAAPALLLAGTKDDLVPVEHSRRLFQALEEAEVPARLVEYENSGHGLLPEDMKRSLEEMAAWFDAHLLGD